LFERAVGGRDLSGNPPTEVTFDNVQGYARGRELAVVPAKKEATGPRFFVRFYGLVLSAVI